MNEGIKRALLTQRGIAAMTAGTWAADPAARGMGVLQVRKLADGTPAFYYRYTAPDGERVRLPIGNGIDLREARRLAAELSRRYQSGDKDLRTALAAEERERQRLQDAATEAASAEAATKRATLGALLTGYVDQLKRDGKTDAGKVEGTIHRHVRDAWPKLWATPATRVTTEDLLCTLARLTDDGKLREAAKLRSYLSAGYAAAIRARQDARGLAALRALKIAHNPARDLVTVDGSNRGLGRALSLAEMRAYWRRICALPGPGGALLRFHLLTGGQRTEQLGRLTTDDYDTDLHTVRILDGKGRRKAARLHDVPLVPAAIEAMRAMGQEMGPYLVTITHGQSGAVYASFQHRVRAVAEAMDEAGELEKGPFTVGGLRRTVETRLAAVGVSKEIRAHLQSHGLGGVQDRHYDRHEYLDEKRAALETLYGLLVGTPAKVTSIRKNAIART